MPSKKTPLEAPSAKQSQPAKAAVKTAKPASAKTPVNTAKPSAAKSAVKTAKSRAAKTAVKTAKPSAAKASAKTSKEVFAKVAPKTKNAPLILVGIGASAGGLEALTPFVGNLPLRSNMAYIIAQHVSPSHRSMMVELLSRATKLQVVEAEHEQLIERNIIYITPPKHDISVDKTRILLSEPHSPIGAKPSVNYLFTSMAEVFGESAIGVILSGTGSDGTQGARALLTKGGIVIAQDSDSAKYDSMPRSAVRAELVDLILKPADAARQLERIAATPRAELAQVVLNSEASLVHDLVNRIFKATGHDFRSYKEATISRQIQRRIIALQIATPEAYVQYTEDNPRELHELQKTFLISVTAFYRDPDSFLALRGVLSNIIKSKSNGDNIRIWVPACATGEEVYTIAYLMADLLGADLNNYNIKIFGTDMSQPATDVARAGVYPEASLDEVGPGVRDKYFVADANGYKVKKFVREMVLFAQHDLVQDPPFLKMDLVSCRNLLIYLKPDLQDKLFSLFHYSLNKSGYLFLGKSETVGSSAHLFSTLDQKSRLYRRTNVTTPRLMPISGARLNNESGTTSVTKRKQENRQYIIERLNDLYVPPSVLITTNFEPVHFVGDLSRYLSFPTGAANFSLFSLIAPEIRAEMRALVHKCISTGETVTGHLLPIKKGGDIHRIRPIMRTMEIFDSGEFGVLISFEEHLVIKGGMESVPEDMDDVTRQRFAELETELSGTRDHLQAVVEELETSNEELQSLNEEMQASSEELQASNEELETTNEELQATNEELATVNDELEAKSFQIAEINDILENVQNSVNSAIVVLDQRMNVVRYTPQTVRLFGIMAGDIGSAITSVTCHLKVSNLDAKLRSVIADGEILVEETGTTNAHYIMQLAPYIDHLGVRKGAVMSFTDITEITESRRARAEEEEKFRRITESLQEVVWMATPDSKTLLYVSPNANHHWGVSAEELQKDPSMFIDAVHADDQKRVLAERKPKRGSRWSTEYRIVLPSGEVRWIRDQGTTVKNDKGQVQSLVGSAIDITPRVQAESALRASEAQFKAVFRSSGVGLAIVSPEGVLLEANHALESYLGYGSGELSNVHFADITLDDDTQQDLDLFSELVRGERTYYSLEKRYRSKTGGVIWGHLTVTYSPETADYGAFAVSVVNDISDRIQREKLIHRQANFDTVTSLPNRGMVRRQLENTLAGLDEGMKASLFFIDLDGFKDVNDTYGHAAGDTVLRAFGTRLAESVRAFDCVARWGGDEFVCILKHGLDDSNVTEIAQRVIEVSQLPISVTGANARISSSVGVAVYPQDSDDSEGLIQAADLAMYQAKRAGKNCYRLYDESMSAGVTVRMHAQAMLDQALNSDTLEMHYQPIFDNTGERVIAAEALLRWRHPDDGLVSPFADYLEHATSQMLESVDNWAATRVAEEVKANHSKLPEHLRIHMNVFPDRLERNGFVNEVLNGDKQDYFSRMTVELTEREFEFNSEAVIDILTRLRAAGVHISIDDFGTGYSSLGMLSSVEVDQIKIDKLFVDEIMSDTLKGVKFIDSVVGLAEGLRLEVIAEGIEHQAQLDEVAPLVGGLQGYLLATPMLMGELIEFSKKKHA